MENYITKPLSKDVVKNRQAKNVETNLSTISEVFKAGSSGFVKLFLAFVMLTVLTDF